MAVCVGSILWYVFYYGSSVCFEAKSPEGTVNGFDESILNMRVAKPVAWQTLVHPRH